MADRKSSIKRIRQNRKREQRNVAVKTAVKTAIRRVEQAVRAGDLEAAKVNYSAAVSALDSASAKGILKKNTTSRKKSRLAKLINAAEKAA